MKEQKVYNEDVKSDKKVAPDAGNPSHDEASDAKMADAAAAESAKMADDAKAKDSDPELDAAEEASDEAARAIATGIIQYPHQMQGAQAA